ncbi:MAG: type IV pilus twitching motility protein PilT [Candidatus Eremiobacterota bacterium]
MDFFSKFRKKPSSAISTLSITAQVDEISLDEDNLNEPPDEMEHEPVDKDNISEVKPIELNLPSLKLSNLLKALVELGGSDLHLEAGSPPVYRIKGDICFTKKRPLNNTQVYTLIKHLIRGENKNIFERVGNLDLAHEIPGVARFRVNILRQHHGVGAVFRVIPTKIPTIEQLNLPPVLKKISMFNRGIVIVTGPTGSGKSTTMAAMINYVNNIREAHIITIEDPIEFTHPSLKCLVDHREIGSHATSFPAALKAALREDPDIVLVGEMRDLETISLAMTAAETGVLVFGTLHTNSAAKTIDRIIDVFPAKQQEQARSQLAQSLKAIIAQQLLKTADGSGRVAVNEILVCNTGISNLIRENRTGQISSFIQMGKDEGMQSMDAALLDLYKTGKISARTAFERAIEKSRFEKFLM